MELSCTRMRLSVGLAQGEFKGRLLPYPPSHTATLPLHLVTGVYLCRRIGQASQKHSVPPRSWHCGAPGTGQTNSCPQACVLQMPRAGGGSGRELLRFGSEWKCGRTWLRRAPRCAVVSRALGYTSIAGPPALAAAWRPDAVPSPGHRQHPHHRAAHRVHDPHG